MVQATLCRPDRQLLPNRERSPGESEQQYRVWQPAPCQARDEFEESRHSLGGRTDAVQDSVRRLVVCVHVAGFADVGVNQANGCWWLDDGLGQSEFIANTADLSLDRFEQQRTVVYVTRLIAKDGLEEVVQAGGRRKFLG